MALWDDLSKKASETTAKAVQQAKIFAETSKLNGMISDEEKKIDGNYYQIGKLYAATYRSNPDEAFAGMLAAITESEEKIQQYRMQILQVKGVLLCEKCGAEVAKGVAFCTGCGSPMPKTEPSVSDTHNKCASCGAMVEKHMRFCTSCGKPMAVPAPQPVPQPATQRTCPTCGHVLSPDVAFCTECGTKL